MTESLSVQPFEQWTKKENKKNEGSIPDSDIISSIMVSGENYREEGERVDRISTILFPSFRNHKEDEEGYSCCFFSKGFVFVKKHQVKRFRFFKEKKKE